MKNALLLPLLLLCSSFLSGSKNETKIRDINRSADHIDSLCAGFIAPEKKDSVHFENFTDTLNGVIRHWVNNGDCHTVTLYKNTEGPLKCVIILANTKQSYYFLHNRLIKYFMDGSAPRELCLEPNGSPSRKMYFSRHKLIKEKGVDYKAEESYSPGYVLSNARQIRRYSERFTEKDGFNIY